MSKQSILPEELTTFKYYVNKCPLYLRNDENFLEHFRIWFDFLMGQSSYSGTYNTSETLLKLMNVFDQDYLDILNSLEGDVGSDMLDKLGSIFNIRRNFSVTFANNEIHEIFLDDNEFLLFIKAQIIKNYSNGSYKQMREFYDKAGLLIYFHTVSPASTTAYLLSLSSADVSYSENIKDLFKAGLLTIESMGINYMYNIQPYDQMLIWVALDAPADWDGKGWDEGEWIL